MARRADHERWEAEDRCTGCGGARDREGRKLCRRCCDTRTEAGAERYRARRRAGLCPKCGEKPEPDRMLCRSCLDKQNARRDKKGETRNRWVTKLQAMVIQADGFPACECCGDTRLECLTLDHREQDGAEARRFSPREGAVSLQRDIIQFGPRPDLRVLCMSCNLSAFRNQGTPRPPRFLHGSNVGDLNRDVEILTEASRPGKKGSGRKRWTRKA